MIGPGLEGILLLNALFLAAGTVLLWGLRGWATWLELLELLGLCLVLGTCSVGVLATLVLIAGFGLPTSTILLLAAAVAAAGLLLGLRAGRRLPRRLGPLPRVSVANGVAGVCALASLSIVVSFFRIARVTPIGGGDSWEDWVPKAKIIYFYGKIASPLFLSISAPRYPIFVPTLQAMDFRFMGAAYGPALAVQYWLLYVSFVLAAAAILRRLAPAPLAWLFVALTGVIPQLDDRFLGAQADWTLDVQFALAALLATWWLRSRESWLLVALAIVLSALIATKQEGLLLAGCLYVGLAAATRRSWRHTWPPLLAVGVAAYLVNLPWRIWWGERHLPPVLPTIGWVALLHHLHRGWASLHLILRLVFAYGMWLGFVPIAIGAAAAALTLRGEDREAATLYLVTAAAAVAGFTYILWSDLTYTLNEAQSTTPMPRAVGSIVLLSVVFAPVLIAPLLRRSPPGAERDPPG